MNDQLIDRIYEAALVPDLWPAVCDEIAAMSGTEGGILFAVAPPSKTIDGKPVPPISRWLASDSLADIFATFVRDGWPDRNPRAARGIALAHAGFVTDADLFTDEEIESEPLYVYLRDRGLGYCTGVVIQPPTGDTLIFDWERRHADGPVDRETVARLDPLRPHLARAALMSSRLGLERARAATETLAFLGLPAAVLSDRGTVVVINALMEGLMPGVVDEGARGQLRLKDMVSDQLFKRAKADASAGGTASHGEDTRVYSVPIPARDDHSAMVVHLVPVRRTARDIFSDAASIVIVTPVSRAIMPDATIIQGLFDLTAAEARIARAIANGDTVSRIAIAANTAEATIRHHLKAVFAKTGAVRQGDLIGMLAGIDPRRSI